MHGCKGHEQGRNRVATIMLFDEKLGSSFGEAFPTCVVFGENGM